MKRMHIRDVWLPSAISFFACGVAASSLQAAVWTVYPTSHIPEKDGAAWGEATMTPGQQLTNAFTQAAASDTILLKNGTYVFGTDEYMGVFGTGNAFKDRLKTKKANLTLAGETTTDRSTWTNGAEPVVIDINGGRGIWVEHDTFTVKHIAFTGANFDESGKWGGAIYSAKSTLAVSNCVFRGNKADIAAVYNGNCYNCFFTNNLCIRRGGVIRAVTAYDCLFADNKATAGNAVGEYVKGLYSCTVRGHIQQPATLAGMDGASAMVSNCVFTGNSQSGSTVSGGRTYGCLFENNKGYRGAAVSGGYHTNDVYRSNVSTDGGGAAQDCRGFSGCRFENNTGHGGGYMCSQDGDSCRFTNCVFTANVSTYASAVLISRVWNGRNGGHPMTKDYISLVDCVISNSAMPLVRTTISDTIPDGCHVQDCLLLERCLVTNNVTGSAALMSAKARGCRLVGNKKTDIAADYTFGDNGYGSWFFDCDISGGAEFYNCLLSDCVIHDCPNRQCVFKNTVVATNCLVANCQLAGNGGVFRHRNGAGDDPSTIVNCTFVGLKGAMFSNMTNITLVNCAFFSNSNHVGSASAISWDDYSAKPLSHNPTVTFTNCAMGACTSGIAPIYGQDNRTDIADPKFNAGRDPTHPDYEPRAISPLRGWGLPLAYAAADVDLAGHPRVRDGKVDIGCYQSWILPPGFILLVR